MLDAALEHSRMRDELEAVDTFLSAIPAIEEFGPADSEVGSFALPLPEVLEE